MILKIYKLCLVISLLTLQSCSGSKLGDFLELSFDNIKEEESNIELKDNLENQSDIEVKDNLENQSDIEVKDNVEKNLLNKSDYKPYSYRIIILLKDVDPSSPVEIFSSVLKESNVDFEIEKIEIYQDE